MAKISAQAGRASVTTAASANQVDDCISITTQDYCFQNDSFDQHQYASMTTDSQVYLSPEFQAATEFDPFTSFELAVTFLTQTINLSECFNVTEFLDNLLDRLYNVRKALKQFKQNPQLGATVIQTESQSVINLKTFLDKNRIFSLNIEQSDSEANFFFLMDLMRACLVAGNRVPIELPHVILQKLHFCIKYQRLLQLQDKHLHLARDVFQQMKAIESKPLDFLRLYGQTFDFPLLSDNRLFGRDEVLRYDAYQNFVGASKCIVAFDLHQEIGSQKIIELCWKLTKFGQCDEVVELLRPCHPSLWDQVVQILQADENIDYQNSAKTIFKIIQELNICPDYYNKLFKEVSQTTIDKTLDKCFRFASNHEDHIPFQHIVDKCMPRPFLMSYLVRRLIELGQQETMNILGEDKIKASDKFMKAAFAFNSFKLPSDRTLELTCDLTQTQQSYLNSSIEFYSWELSSQAEDKFGPVSAECFSLQNSDTQLVIVDTNDALQQMAQTLTEEQMIAMTIEQNSQLVPYDKERISLINISLNERTFIIDMLEVDQTPQFTSQVLDIVLTQILSLDLTTVVVFDLDFLQASLAKKLPWMQFHKGLCRSRDLRSAIRRPLQRQTMKQDLEQSAYDFNIRLCSHEKSSNWLMRPLRQSQLHHAAAKAGALLSMAKMV